MATTRSTAAKRPPVRGKTGTQSKRFGPENSFLSGVSPKYHTPIFIGMILVSLLIFFGGVIFGNKLFVSGDFLSWEAFRPYLNMMDEKGEAPLWMPYIFSGMPGIGAYLVTGDRWWDLSMKIFYSSEHIFGFINYPVMRVVMHYFIYGVGMYLLMRSRKAARSTAFFVSLAAMFSTWIIIYIMIGHNTKIMALMTFPYIFLCLDRLTRRWSLLYAGLLILAVHILYESSHVQTAFYGGCAIGIWLFVELLSAILAKEKGEGGVFGVVRAGAIAIVAVGMTYAMGYDRTSEVQNYLPYSTRGATGILEQQKTGAEKQAEEGHGYDYATGWSFSPAETFTYMVPGYFGFGSLEVDGKEESTYWGQMRFTDAGHYMGIAVLILGIFGFWMNRRSKFVQALFAIGLFGLILSYGRNWSILYDLFYNLVPSFNKFRAPSQSLILLEFVFPILAGFGIESLIAMHKSGDNPKSDKSILMGAVVFGVFTLIGLTGMIKGPYTAAVTSAASNPEMPRPNLMNPNVFDAIYSTMIGDWIIAGLFGVATLLLMYFYVKGRITGPVLKMALLLILVADLWRIAYRPMDTQPADILQQQFAETDVDKFLKSDTTKHRILDLTKPSANYSAYNFQEQIIGYSSAKMRAYQDLLEVAGNGNVPISPTAWRMLNTKYIVVPQMMEGMERMEQVFTSSEVQAIVLRNPDALPRAWFVNKVEEADGKAILEKIRDNAFDPHDIAYIAEPLKEPIEPVGYAAGQLMVPDSATIAAKRASGDTTGLGPQLVGGTPAKGSVTVTKHEPLHIEMAVDAPGKNFLVVSEMHYPVAWRATIDGQPAEIVQTDYVLRGLVVPPGKHTIKMDYVAPSFETGKWISLALNLLTFALIGVGAVLERRRRPEPDPEHNAPVIDVEDV